VGQGGGCRGGDLTEGRVVWEDEETVEGVEAAATQQQLGLD